MPAQVATPPADAASIAKAREAMEQKLKEVQTQPPAVTAPAAPTPAMPAAQPTPSKPSSVKGAQAFPSIEGPAPAVSTDKEQRLQELLRKYQADQITPGEYLQQRAKILAGP
jgi:hypothetical protein